jgi:hypothetical protein
MKFNETIILTKQETREYAYQDYLTQKKRMQGIIKDLPWVLDE